MAKNKVIMAKNLPPKIPILSTCVAWLLLDRFSAAGWIWGVVGTILLVIWIGCIVGFIKAEFVDIFDTSESDSGGPDRVSQINQ